MLVNENDSSNESESSSSKTPGTGDTSCSSNGRDSNEGKSLAATKDLHSPLYDDSEIVDSEDIFESYIGSKDGGDDEDDDDEMKAQNQSCQSSSSSSSSKLENISCPEKSEDKKDFAIALKECNSMTACRSGLEDQECHKKAGESLEQTRKPNPFSVKNKGMYDQMSSKLTESDSDDDDFVTVAPRSSQELKPKPEAGTSTQEDKETSLNNISTSSVVNAKPALPKTKKKSKPRARTNANDPWSCRACTFINDPQMVECSICFTPKPEKQVLDGEETMATSADLTENGCQIDDRTSDYFSGSSTNTEASDDARAFTSCSMLCKDDGRPTDSCQPLREIIQEENEVNEIKNKCSSVCKNTTSPTILCEDEDLDDFSRESFLQWSCSACTFLNDAMLNECCICMMPRRRSQRKTKSRWSTWSWEKRRLERYKRSCKKKAIKRSEGEHEKEVERSAAAEDDNDKVIDKEGAPFESTTKPRQTTRTRKKLNMEGQVGGTLLVNDECLFEKGQKCTISDAVEGKLDEKGSQNDAKEREQLSVRTRGCSEEEREETEENPFILEFSDSDATDDDKETRDIINESLSAIVTPRATQEGDSTSNIVTPEQTVRGEEICMDDCDESIVGRKQGPSLENGQSSTPGEGSMPVNMMEQQTTTGEGREGNEDSHAGKEKSSCENELAEPREDCKLIPMEGQQSTNGKDGEGNHAGKEKMSCENALLKPLEDSISTNTAEQQNSGEHETTDDIDVAILGRRNSTAKFNNGQTNSLNENNSKDTEKQQSVSEKQVVKGDGDNMTQQSRNEGERGDIENHENDSLSDNKTSEREESLQELQEAAEEIFGGDGDFDDLPMGNDLDETKFNDVVVRKPKDPPEPITLQYSLSLYTDRVYLYDEVRLECELGKGFFSIPSNA